MQAQQAAAECDARIDITSTQHMYHVSAATTDRLLQLLLLNADKGSFSSASVAHRHLLAVSKTLQHRELNIMLCNVIPVHKTSP